MKTKFLTVFLILVAFTGCKKEIKMQTENVQSSEKTTQWDVMINRPVFSSTEATVDSSCMKFNNYTQTLTTGLQDSLIAQAKRDYAAMDAAGETMTGPYQLIVKDSVFQVDENYISVRLLTYTFTGGAHGMTNFYGLNYDIKNRKLLSNQEILDYSKAAGINDLLKKHLQNPDNCFNEIPTIENFSTLNISATSANFTYEQYILGPYSCGYATIAIPLTEMKGMLLIK